MSDDLCPCDMDDEAAAAADMLRLADFSFPLLHQPGFKELVLYLRGLIAENEGWHTFTMCIKAAPDGKTALVDDVSLLPVAMKP